MAVVDKLVLKDPNNTDVEYDIGASAQNVSYTDGSTPTTVKGKLDSINTNHINVNVLGSEAHGIRGVKTGTSGNEKYSIEVKDGNNWHPIESGGLPETPLSRQHGGTGNIEGYIQTGYKNLSEKGVGVTIEGTDNECAGDYGHVEGVHNVASGDYSHAEGENTTASEEASHAEGYETTASGSYSHTEGEGTTARGIASHAEGDSTTATGNYSHTEGDNTEVTSTGYAAHAEGSGTVASGIAAHAEGGSTVASGQYSHAGGIHTIADYTGSFVHGVGTSDNKLEAHGVGSFVVGDNSEEKISNYDSEIGGFCFGVSTEGGCTNPINGCAKVLAKNESLTLNNLTGFGIYMLYVFLAKQGSPAFSGSSVPGVFIVLTGAENTVGGTRMQQIDPTVVPITTAPSGFSVGFTGTALEMENTDYTYAQVRLIRIA